MAFTTVLALWRATCSPFLLLFCQDSEGKEDTMTVSEALTVPLLPALGGKTIGSGWVRAASGPFSA